jgi:hypothetical protein
MNGERQTGAERHHGIELPAVGDPMRAVRGAREVVNGVGGEVVAHVVDASDGLIREPGRGDTVDIHDRNWQGALAYAKL